MIRKLLIAALAMMLVARAAAEPAPLRVAVISDNEAQDLTALITANLSGSRILSLIERDDMAKIGDELKLQQLAGTDAVGLGRILGADGLLFVKKQPAGFQIRLTAVGLGYAVFDDPMNTDAGTDLPHLAQAIAQRVIDYAPKLKLKPETAVPISVLNIRSDFSTAQSVALERKLTLLLESQLSALPEYVVLERRHAGALLFEKSLASGVPAPLQGTYVVDGAFTQPAEGAKEMAVHLRLRSPDNQQNPIEIQGSMQDLPGLATKMVGEIQKTIGKPVSPSSWQPSGEAREYLLEGIWGQEHGDADAAIEALDSAEMLGEKSPDLLVTRLIALCEKAVGASAVAHGFPQTPDDPNPAARIEAILRAFDDEARYESAGGPNGFEVIKASESMDVSVEQVRGMLVRSASSLLGMLDRTHSSHADDVRTPLCAFAQFDPLHGQLSPDFADAAMFIDDWAKSPDEEEAFYRVMMTTPARGWFMMQEFLNPDHFCARFIPDPVQRHEAFMKFMQSMAEDPAGKPTGLLELAKYADPAQQEDALRDLAADLTAERDALFASGRLFQFLAGAFQIEKERGDPLADPGLIALLHFELQHAAVDGHLDQIWYPDLFPKDEAPALWSELQQARARTPSGTESDLFYSHMSARFVDRWGNPDATQPSVPVLVVDRFWRPRDDDRHDYICMDSGDLAPDANGVWVQEGMTQEKAYIYHIAIDPTQANPFTTGPSITPDGFYPHEIVVTTGMLYVLGEPPGQWHKSIMARYDLNSGQWDHHNVPFSRSLFAAAGKLYLSLASVEAAAVEGGIARYDDQTGDTTVLADSRRRPAQNQFDDRDGYDVCSIFTGPGNEPCASIGFGETYSILDSPGDWPRLIDSGELYLAETDGTRTILYGQRSSRDPALGAVVFMIDPAKPKPELWLGAPTPSFGTHMVGLPDRTPPAPWLTPPAWSGSPPWNNYAAYGFRGDDLFSYVTDPGTLKNELVWWRKDQPGPVHIPLAFKMGDGDAAALKQAEEDDPLHMRFHQSLNAGFRIGVGPIGIFFLVPGKGFYFLPYSDVDAYLKDVPSTPAK